MDRRSLIKHAGVAGVLSAGVAPAVHAQAAVRWRMASSFPKSLPTIFGSAEKFSETVKALSGGYMEGATRTTRGTQPRGKSEPRHTRASGISGDRAQVAYPTQSGTRNPRAAQSARAGYRDPDVYSRGGNAQVAGVRSSEGNAYASQAPRAAQGKVRVPTTSRGARTPSATYSKGKRRP